MNFSLEELIDANNNGSLESLLLGYGLSLLEVLKFVLKEAEENDNWLWDQILELQADLNYYG